jgi:hypothetical protein
MREGGLLGEEELETRGGAFAVGDRVIVKRNEPTLELANGDRAVVTRVDIRRHPLEVENGGRASSLTARSWTAVAAAATPRSCTATR